MYGGIPFPHLFDLTAGTFTIPGAGASAINPPTADSAAALAALQATERMIIDVAEVSATSGPCQVTIRDQAAGQIVMQLSVGADGHKDCWEGRIMSAPGQPFEVTVSATVTGQLRVKLDKTG